MKENIQIVSDLTNKVEMPTINLGRGIQKIYKTKARKLFETMKVGQSFSIANRSVEAVKRWSKDWRRDLRATGKKKDATLADRGFITKYEIVGKTQGVRIWRYI